MIDTRSDEKIFLVDGYGSYEHAKILTGEQGYQMSQSGFTVLTYREYKNKCIELGLCSEKSKLIFHAD